MVRAYISYANVDTEWQYRLGTLAGTDAIGERNTFSVTVFSATGAAIPETGQPIRICDDTLGNLYGGTINQVQATFFQGAQAIDLALSCSSWDALCDRHVVEAEQDYNNTAAGDVIKAIFATGTIAGEGVYMTGVADGPMITASFSYQTVATALDAITAQCPGYYWKIDADKVLHFDLLSASPAPFNFSANDDHIFGPPIVTWTREKYANRFIGVLQKYAGDAQVETFPGDGTNQTFTVSAPIATIPAVSVRPAVRVLSEYDEPPFVTELWRSDYYLSSAIYGIISITLDGNPQRAGYSGENDGGTPFDWIYDEGTSRIVQVVPTAGTVVVAFQTWYGQYTLGAPVPQTVGASGVTTGFQWYWTEGSQDVTQDGAQTPVPSTSQVVITYSPENVKVIYKSNASEISARAAIEGGTGVYTQVWSYSDLISFSTADSMSQGYVDIFSSIPLIYEASTRYIGLAAGQSVSVTIGHAQLSDGSYPLINTVFAIQSVSIQDVGGDLRWNVRAVNGALIPFGYQALAQMIAGTSDGGVNALAVAGSGSGGSGGGDSGVTINGVPVTY